MGARCCVPDINWTADTVSLGRETTHHITRVLRMQTGDALEVFDGKGCAADGTLIEVAKHAATVRIGTVTSTPPLAPHITLVQALIRPQPMDWVIRKATELGANAVQPVLTSRCVARTKERPERWAKTVISAAEQCGARWLPDVQPIRTWDEWGATTESWDAVYLCALTSSARPLRDGVRGARTVPERVAVLVGPEGDFTGEEMEAAIGQGAQAVSLGPLTLRAETAALFALAALRYEWTADGTSVDFQPMSG